MQQQDISELIFQSRQQDLNAFRQLVEIHQPMVYRLAFRLLYNEDDARDATQETFIRVWKYLHRFDLTMRFSTWLYKITTNICYDRIRALKRRNNILSFDMDHALLLNQPSSDNIETALIYQEMAALVKILTEELTPKQKLVFTLRDLEGLEVEEIVTITGLSPAKIKSNLYCARQYIRQKLEKL
jgi:RNA polymerase sigma-70 factor, ECF subfamily